MEKENKSWFIKNWSNILFVIVLILFLIPSTRFQMQVFINEVFSFSPSIENEEKLAQITDYNWKLVDHDDVAVNFTTSKNKVIVINYWASWCGPCVAEMPSLQNLYTKFKNEVDFYFVAKDNKEAVEAFMQSKKYTFPVYYELQPAPLILQNNILPTSYLIDQKGNIRIAETGAADWNSEKIHRFITQLLQNQQTTVD